MTQRTLSQMEQVGQGRQFLPSEFLVPWRGRQKRQHPCKLKVCWHSLTLRGYSWALESELPCAPVSGGPMKRPSQGIDRPWKQSWTGRNIPATDLSDDPGQITASFCFHIFKQGVVVQGFHAALLGCPDVYPPISQDQLIKDEMRSRGL